MISILIVFAVIILLGIWAKSSADATWRSHSVVYAQVWRWQCQRCGTMLPNNDPYCPCEDLPDDWFRAVHDPRGPGLKAVLPKDDFDEWEFELVN